MTTQEPLPAPFALRTPASFAAHRRQRSLWTDMDDDDVKFGSVVVVDVSAGSDDSVRDDSAPSTSPSAKSSPGSGNSLSPPSGGCDAERSDNASPRAASPLSDALTPKPVSAVYRIPQRTVSSPVITAPPPTPSTAHRQRGPPHPLSLPDIKLKGALSAPVRPSRLNAAASARGLAVDVKYPNSAVPRRLSVEPSPGLAVPRARGLTVAVLTDGEIVAESTPVTPTAPLTAVPKTSPKTNEKDKEIILCRYYHTRGLTCTSSPCRFVHNLSALGMGITRGPASASLSGYPLVSPPSTGRKAAPNSPDPTSGTFALAQDTAPLPMAPVIQLLAEDMSAVRPGETVAVCDLESGAEVVGTVFKLSGGGKGPAGKSRLKWKTVPCRGFASGHCAYGEYCSFIHDERNLADLAEGEVKCQGTESDTAKVGEPVSAIQQPKVVQPAPVEHDIVAEPTSAMEQAEVTGQPEPTPAIEQPKVVEQTTAAEPAPATEQPKPPTVSYANAASKLLADPFPSLKVKKPLQADTVQPAPAISQAPVHAKEPFPALTSKAALADEPYRIPGDLPVLQLQTAAPLLNPAPRAWRTERPESLVLAKRNSTPPLHPRVTATPPRHATPLPKAGSQPATPTCVMGVPAAPPMTMSRSITSESDPASPWDPALKFPAMLEGEAYDATPTDMHLQPGAPPSQPPWHGPWTSGWPEQQLDYPPYTPFPQLQAYEYGARPYYQSQLYEAAPMQSPLEPINPITPGYPVSPTSSVAMSPMSSTSSFWNQGWDGAVFTPRTRSYFRTKPCRFFQQGVCPHGEACTYSHVLPAEPPKSAIVPFKTMPCKYFNSAAGCARTDAECSFAHVRVLSDEALPAQPQRFRTRPCRHFQVGRCRFGAECHFAHVVDEGMRAKEIAAQKERDEGKSPPAAPRSPAARSAGSTSPKVTRCVSAPTWPLSARSHVSASARSAGSPIRHPSSPSARSPSVFSPVLPSPRSHGSPRWPPCAEWATHGRCTAAFCTDAHDGPGAEPAPLELADSVDISDTEGAIALTAEALAATCERLRHMTPSQESDDDDDDDDDVEIVTVATNSRSSQSG